MLFRYYLFILISDSLFLLRSFIRLHFEPQLSSPFYSIFLLDKRYPFPYFFSNTTRLRRNALCNSLSLCDTEVKFLTLKQRALGKVCQLTPLRPVAAHHRPSPAR